MPPDSISPDAPRFDKVTRYSWPVRQRVLFAVAGALASLAGAALMVMGGHTWASYLVAGGILAVLLGAEGGGERYEYQEKLDGAYVLAPAEVEARITGRQEQKIQASVGRARAGALVVGVAAALGSLSTVLRALESPSEWVTVLWLGVLAVGMLRFAIKGDMRFLPLSDADEPDPGSPRFHELADPTRPLRPGADRDAATRRDLPPGP